MIVNILRPVHFRGKLRLFKLFGGAGQGVRTIELFGSTFELDLAEMNQRLIYQGAFEPHETRLIRKYLKAGMTFVDAGANVGYYTALGSYLTGAEGRVVAFEPSPYAFARLKRMIDRNALKQAQAVNAALGQTPGTLTLYINQNSDNHSPSMVRTEENATTTPVPVKTLDEEADRMGLKRIDLIKIDVEGYEPLVLEGAKRLLAERRIGAILCEFNPWWLEKAGSSAGCLEKIIYEAGMADVTEKKPHKGLFDIQNRMFALRT